MFMKGSPSNTASQNEATTSKKGKKTEDYEEVFDHLEELDFDEEEM